jgi:proline iminopeptidase
VRAFGAQDDTMDPKATERMAAAVKHGRYLYCPSGSHTAMYDDQQTYFAGLVRFLRDVDQRRF